jgi:hypothetical protein
VSQDAGVAFVGGGVNDGDFAHPGSAERERQRRSGLPAADHHHVVVDTNPIRHPVSRIRSDLAHCVQGGFIRISGHQEPSGSFTRTIRDRDPFAKTRTVI